MNIPVIIKKTGAHPELNDRVFKGIDFKLQTDLYERLQETACDPALNSLNNIADIENNCITFEKEIIERTKATITVEDQANGKLLKRTQCDAERLNNLSSQFFSLIYGICREANLSSMVPIVRASSMNSKRRQVASEKIMPGIASFAISKCLDQAIKRCRRICQRSAMLSKATRIILSSKILGQATKEKRRVFQCAKRLIRQREEFYVTIHSLIEICHQIATDRKNQIIAIEQARGQRIFDKHCEFQTSAIEITGKNDYDKYTHQVKEIIFGAENVKSLNAEKEERFPKSQRLLAEFNEWGKFMITLESFSRTNINDTKLQTWEQVAQTIKHKSQRLLKTLQKIQQEEWINSKTHYLRIGKNGPIARMTNPKPRTGPVAGHRGRNPSYP
eukprot:CAMPEP_0172431060 /NCGR_PEP_ID=MMETSP1064-20121228/57072_1 /TAXON_ID=202472 /ORGANISM="Aulacoseira subarctica , Strain CCAP 1002/5" /LENGTH=388 /DNA_ID=CAMNT_0013177531 /DNA_START=30 /DNA_END=1192 /DNA_ORIENTATION=-